MVPATDPATAPSSLKQPVTKLHALPSRGRGNSCLQGPTGKHIHPCSKAGRLTWVQMLILKQPCNSAPDPVSYRMGTVLLTQDLEGDTAHYATKFRPANFGPTVNPQAGLRPSSKPHLAIVQDQSCLSGDLTNYLPGALLGTKRKPHPSMPPGTGLSPADLKEDP